MYIFEDQNHTLGKILKKCNKYIISTNKQKNIFSKTSKNKKMSIVQFVAKTDLSTIFFSKWDIILQCDTILNGGNTSIAIIECHFQS